MSAQCETTARRAARAEMGVFERYLTLWVFLCIIAGIVLGHFASAPFQIIGRMEIARVNLPVAALIWLMIIPMLLKIDFHALHVLGALGICDDAQVVVFIEHLVIGGFLVVYGGLIRKAGTATGLRLNLPQEVRLSGQTGEEFYDVDITSQVLGDSGEEKTVTVTLRCRPTGIDVVGVQRLP